MNSSVASIYLNGAYASQNPAFGDDDAAWKAGNVLRMIRKLGLRPKRVCEVGCGGGGILLRLREELPSDVEFTGFEPMPEAFRICQSRADDRMRFFNESPAKPSAEGPFDLVLCADVFEHVEDYLGFLRGLSPLGRTFIFHVPLDMSVQAVFRMEPILRVRRNVGHLHYFSKETALATLRDAGFETRQWFFTDGSQSTYRSWRFRLMKLPRRFFFSCAPNLTVRLLGGYSLMVAAAPNGSAR